MQTELPEDARSVEAIRRLMTELCKALSALAEGVAKAAPDAVRELLVRRAEVVPSIDERLVKVAELIRRGLRDEAIGYAAEPPELVDAATLLDLSSNPQWGQWLAALTEQIIPEPAMPRMDLVETLVKAQDDVVRFKPLLDTWRRMNLANSPLRDRIAMLGKFREVDPANELWFEALREHQKQRLMELEREIRAATAQRDEPRLGAIVEEMQHEWIEAVPARLKAAATTALESFRGSRIDRDLEEVSGTLAAAYEGRDLEAARELRQRWGALVDEKGAMAADDVRLQAALPAVEWVDNHDRMREVTEEIWNSLDSRPGGVRARREWVRSLERLGNEMEDLAEKLPGEFDAEAIDRGHDRIRRVREALDRDEGFRRKMMYVGIGSAAMLLGVAVWYFDDQGRLKQQVSAATRELLVMQEDIANGKSLELPDFEAKWPSRVAGDPVVASKLAAARAELKSQNERRERLANLLAAVERAREVAGDAERLDPLSPWPPAFAEATRGLAAISDGGLAVTDQERADCVTATGGIDRLKKRFTAEADAFVRERAKTLDTDLDRARAMLVTDREGAKKLLSEVFQGIESLRTQADAQAAPESSKAYAGLRLTSVELIRMLAGDGPLAKKASSLDSMLTARERFDDALDMLGSKLGDWEAYQEQLESIGRDFADVTEASDYSRAAESASLWEAVDEWRRFVKSLPRLDSVNPAKASETSAAFASLTGSTKNLPMARGFERDVLPALEQLGDRDLEAARADLSQWFGGTWLGDLKFLVTDEGGATYYCLAPVELGAANFESVSGAKDAEGRWPQKTVRKEVAAARPTPQAALSEKLLGMTRPGRFPDTGLDFDEWVIAAVKEILKDEAVDPLIKVLAVRKCLLVAAELSRPIRQAGRPVLAALDDGQGRVSGISPDQFWSFLSPKTADYLLVRPKAEQLLVDIRNGLAAIEAAIERERALLANPVPEVPRLVGRLGRNAAGEFVAIWKGEPAKPGDVWWVASEREFRPAGAVQDNGDFRPADKTGPAGTPLYVKEPMTAPGVRPNSSTQPVGSQR